MPTVDDELQPVHTDSILPPISELPIQVEEDPTPEKRVEDSVSKFDARHREPFIGLMFLGSLKKDVKRFGHTFSIETPTQRARLEAGVLHKQFVNTLSAEIGWAALSVACYLQAVDGIPLPEPISANPNDTGVSDRYNWVIDNLRQSVINALFEEILSLDVQVQAVLNELHSLGETSG